MIPQKHLYIPLIFIICLFRYTHQEINIVEQNVRQIISNHLQDQNKYRYIQNITLPQTVSNLKQLSIVNDSAIALIGSKQIKTFTGLNYSIKSQQINITDQSQVKIIGNKIFINDRHIITQINNQTNQKYQFNNQGQLDKPLVTQNYILFNKFGQQCPTLFKIDRKTMASQTIYPDGKQSCSCPNCSKYWSGLLKDLQNGKIVYTLQKLIYILNKQTLQVQQIIRQEFLGQGMQYDYIDSWYDKDKQDSTILIKDITNRYTTYIYNKQTKQYERSARFGASDNMKLVGINQAYSFRGNYIYHWGNLTKQIYVDYTNKQSTLTNNYFMVMSKSQSFFIMMEFPNIFTINRLKSQSPTYQIQQLDKISLGNSVNIQDDALSPAYISTDEKLLFLWTVYFGKNIIVIYNFIDKSIASLTSTQQNKYLSYAIFNAQYNRFVILKMKNETINNETKISYWIEIRQLTDVNKVIKQTQIVIPQSNNSSNLRLLTNDNWNLNFLILYNNLTQSSKSDDKCKQILANINNDNLNYSTPKIQQISYYNTFISDNWVITFPFQKDYLSLYNLSDLSLIKHIPTYNKFSRALDYGVMNPIFFKNQLFMTYRSSIASKYYQIINYDFNTNNPQNITSKTLSTFYYKNTFLNYQSIFFPSKSLFYMFGTQPYKAIFNPNFPIDKKIQMFDTIGDSKIYLQKTDTRPYDMVIDINMTHIRTWQNRQPYNQRIYSASRKNNIQIIECSNKKYIAVKFDYICTGCWVVQILSVQRNFEKVWRYKKNMTSILEFVDITDDGKIIIGQYNYNYNYNYNLTILNLQIKEYGSYYNLLDISDFDSTQDGSIGFVGPIDEQQKIHFIVLDNKKEIKFQKVYQNFNFNQARIVFNQKGQKVIFCYKSKQIIYLQIWNIDKDQLIYQKGFQINLILSLRFINQTHLFIQSDLENFILPITDNQQSILNINQFPNSSIYSINKDGNLLAFATSETIIDIFDSNYNKISHIQLQSNNKILSLTFLNNNTLYIIDNSSKIFTFDSTTCPNTFVNNQNSYCVCRKYSTQKDNICQCNNNFHEAANASCVCQQPFILTQNLDCKCRANQTQEGNDCKCLSNFVKIGSQCHCLDPFILEGNICQCKANQTQVGQDCKCSQNFVKNGTQCSCLDPFIYNQNKCQCRANQIQDGTDCKCLENFVKNGLECECPEPFVLEGNLCKCPKQQFQNGTNCQCNKNFVKKNMSCYCQNPFRLNGENCECSANSTQTLNQCICNQNFEQNQNGLCICRVDFTFQQGKCYCANGRYMSENSCLKCSFWCSQCNGSGLSCTSYSLKFYLIIAGISVISVSLIVAIIIVIKKKLKKPQQQETTIKKKLISEATSKDLLVDQSVQQSIKNKQDN